MLNLKMKKTVKGCPDGLTVIEYQKGETYQVPEELADVFLTQMKVAVKVKEKGAPIKVEKSEIDKIIETTDLKTNPNNDK